MFTSTKMVYVYLYSVSGPQDTSATDLFFSGTFVLDLRFSVRFDFGVLNNDLNACKHLANRDL